MSKKDLKNSNKSIEENQINNFIIKNKKPLIYTWVVFLLFVLLSWVYFFAPKWTINNIIQKLNPWVFQVLWWDFDTNYKKLPYNEDHIDFVFSNDLDQNSISESILDISPKLDWKISIFNWNTIRYKFEQKLNIWDEYIFTFSKNIKSTSWTELWNDTVFDVKIVEEAKVVKINPEWELKNLNQNISVFFNIPVVPLTDLDSRDELPCPISFEPKLEWTCKWTTTSVLEFVPKDGLNWATKYKIKVENKEWLLYNIEPKEWEIQTPLLKLFDLNTFNAKDWINLRFNFPVWIEEIKKKLILYKDNKNDKLAFNITKDLESDSKFNIKLKNQDFSYWTNYKIEIEKWLNSLNWNIPTTFVIYKSLFSSQFLKNSKVYRNIYSNTWELVDTQSIYIWTYESNKYLPVKNIFFNLDFREDIELDKNLFSFETNDWKKIDFNINYIDEEQYNETTKKYETITNKSKIKFELKEDLENNKTYKLIVSKKINKNVNKDLIKTYYTSKKLTITNFKFINYKKSCLYLSNPIEDIWNKTSYIIEITPEARINYIDSYDYIPYNVEWKSKTDEIFKLWYCKEPVSWEYLYVINTRLNPLTKYDLKIKWDFEDKYWNIIWIDTTKQVETWNIKEEDKYLYSWNAKDLNVIPSNLPIVANIQTINLDSINLEICEMDEAWYMDFSNNRWEKWFSPKCIINKKEKLDVKNNFWNISNNRFDLEKDILKEDFKTNFILLKWTKPNWGLWFQDIYIRSNLSIAYEKAYNKSLLFINDFSWELINDIKLDFYKTEYPKKLDLWESKIITNKVDINYELNKQTRTFEINWEQNSFNYFVASSKDYFWFLDLRYDVFSNYDFKYISWETTSEKNYLYLYTERPIYKPGDTVYFKWLLRKFTQNWYQTSDIKKASLDVIDSNYKNISNIDIEVDKNSNFDWEFIIPKDVPLWKFSFRLNVVSWENKYIVRNNAYFYIEEYEKPSFKVTIDEWKKDYILWDDLSLVIKPEYYFWWNIINTTWEYSVLTQNYYFDAKDYSQYQFWEWYGYFNCIYWWECSYNDNLFTSESFEIDENWNYKFNHKFDWEDLEWEKIYNFNFEVKDPDTSNVVSKTVSKVLHNTDWYVWINSDYYNNKKDWINLDWVILDFDAKPIANKTIKIELIRTEWKSVKKMWVDWIFYNEYSREETTENTFSIKSDKKWLFNKNIIPKESWEYIIKATYTWDNKKDFVSSKDIYVAWDDYISWHNDNNDITDLVSDKIQVNVWDTAKYMLKSPINTWKALIVIEKDNYILDYFVHDIKTYSDEINIDVKDNYYPNYYIKAYLIWSEENNPLPIYKRALSITKVSTDYKNLKVDIKTDKKNYLPWEKVKLEVNIKDNMWKAVNNANLSISLVDESLLALKWNPKKNPYAFFYDIKRYLWTSTYWSIKNLIEKLEVKDTSDWEKWWAWEKVKGWDASKKRWEFKDTAFWQANVNTDANWFATIETEALPDNLTTWVIKVLANTKDDNKLWVNYESIITAKKLMINDNLPWFFWSNDEIILSPVVYNKTWKDWDFEVFLNISEAKIIWNQKQSVFIKDWESKTVNFKIKVNDIWISEDKNFYNSKINLKAISKDNSEIDEIEKFVQIKEVSTQEFVSTFWKTKDNSFEEKLELWKIKNSAWKLTINYSATLLNSIIDWVKYLNNYPYWCSEQKTSSIMPNIYIKKLYNSAWEEFDLSTKMIKYWVSDYVWYGEKSIDQVIKEYLVDIRKYQNNDWWFVYWYDENTTYWPNYSDFSLSSYILESASEIKSIWYKLEEETYFDTIAYLKNRFYKNYREWCTITKYDDCKYSEVDRLKAINAILSYDPSDYEAYKMWKLINLNNKNNSTELEKAKVIGKLLKVEQITNEEKEILEKQAKDIVDKILNEELVFNPKWAYLWQSSYYSRFRNTVSLLDAVSQVWLEKFSDIEKIIDNINRWIISRKDSWSYWSTQDNIAFIKAITNYLEASWELKDINYFLKLKLNSEIIEEQKFDDTNKLEVYTKILNLDNLKDSNSFVVEKQWNWTVYYDLNLSYYKDANDIKARDEWFFVENNYYDYNEYKKIQSLKKIEWDKYLKDEISYDELVYKNDIYEYLTPKKQWKVWDLLIVRNKLITTETRDQVSFEWFIPAWAELINPELATSTKKAWEFSDTKSNWEYSSEIWYNNSYRYSYNKNLNFSKIEYRTDRYFAYADFVYPWIHEFTYLIRLTHEWEYSVRPSKASEFYNVEVFWRSAWEKFNISR